MRPLALVYVSLLCAGTGYAQSQLAPFPEPEKVFKSDKQFNALTLGAGNTLTVREPPADLQLEAFDFGANEELLFMEWESGRLETRDIESGKRVAESRPVSGPLFEVKDATTKKALMVVTQHGLIRFVDPHSGKRLRDIQVERGKFDYDIQKMLLAPDGSWLAYVNQDNGKVLDLHSEPPTVLADLEDGYDMAFSPDQTALWIVDRKKLFGVKLDGWKPIGSADLLDQVRPDGTTTLAVVADREVPVAFVPSKSGLLRYELPSLKGRKVTEIPTYWVGADPEHRQVFVHEFKVSALYGADGAVRCRWQIRPAQDFKVSPSGRWLGDRNFGKVELWSTQALMRACSAPGT